MLLKEKQRQKVSSLYISQSDWNLLTLLTSLLKPLYNATIQLQTQKYPTLSLSKIIEKSLFGFFTKKASNENANNNERMIASIIYEKLKHYLVDKIPNEQKKATLVKTYFKY